MQNKMTKKTKAGKLPVSSPHEMYNTIVISASASASGVARMLGSSSSLITLIIISRMLDSLRVFPAEDRDKICLEAGDVTL